MRLPYSVETANVLRAMIATNIDHVRVAGSLYAGVIASVVACVHDDGRHPYLLDFVKEFAASDMWGQLRANTGNQAVVVDAFFGQATAALVRV